MNSLTCQPLCLTYLLYLSQQLCKAGSIIPKYRWRNSDSEMLKNLFNVKQLVRAKMRGTLRYYSLFNLLNYEIVELKLFRGIYLVWIKNILKNWEEIRSLWPVLSHSVTRFRSITYSHPSLHGKILLIFLLSWMTYFPQLKSGRHTCLFTKS